MCSKGSRQNGLVTSEYEVAQGVRALGLGGSEGTIGDSFRAVTRGARVETLAGFGRPALKNNQL